MFIDVWQTFPSPAAAAAGWAPLGMQMLLLLRSFDEDIDIQNRPNDKKKLKGKNFGQTFFFNNFFSEYFKFSN